MSAMLIQGTVALMLIAAVMLAGVAALVAVIIEEVKETRRKSAAQARYAQALAANGGEARKAELLAACRAARISANREAIIMARGTLEAFDLSVALAAR